MPILNLEKILPGKEKVEIAKGWIQSKHQI